jgi:fibronectin-binding autotransporter adhesin
MNRHHYSPRNPRILATSIAAAFLAVLPTRAAVLTWDITPGTVGAGDGAITGGSGTWTTTSVFGSWTSDGGVNNVAWVNNATPDQAVFGDAAGTVTLGSAITANALTFNTTGYAVTGNTLTLAGTTPTITTASGVTATISSVLTGSAGLVKEGTGTLALTAQDTYSGGTIVNGGTLSLGIGGGTGAIRGTLTINSGATLLTTAVNALGFTNNVKVTTINLNNATFNDTAAGDQCWANTINLTGSLMQSNGGTSSTTATQLFSLGGGSVINSLASATQSTIAGRINLRENNTNDQLSFNVDNGAAAVDLLVSAAITANATTRGLVKNGAGTMQLSGQGTFQGNVDVNGGTLIASRAAALGANNGTRQITVHNAGTLMSWTTNNIIVGGGSNAGALPTITLNEGTTLNATRYNAIGNLNLNGATLSQSSTDSGNFEGYLFLGPVTVGGNSPSVISSGNGKANHLRGTSTINFNVADVTGSAAADLTVSNPIRNGSNDYAGAGSLQKTGSGTMTLTAANSYTGTTTINAGTLALSGSASLASANIIAGNGGVFDVMALPANNFTVAAGQTLSAGSTSGFSNDVVGNVTGGTGTVNVAGTGMAGTFTLGGNLTLNGGTMSFDLAETTTVGNAVNDLATVGNLTLSGTTSIAINKLTGMVASSTYTLINYSGTLTGNASNLVLTGAAGGTTRQTFGLDTTTTPGSVLLTVAGNSANLTWVGDGGANAWDISTTVNWTGATDGNNRYFDGDIVTIDDSGSNTPSIALGTTVRPASLTVNNPTKDYTISGAGAIAGSTGLTKNGNGKLTLGTTNSFTGPVAINAGTISVATLANAGLNSGLGAGTSISLGDASNSGTLQYTGATTSTNRPVTLGDAGGKIDVTTAGTTLTETGAFTGTGSLTKTGSGALTINNVISTSGSLTVDGGTLTLLNAQNTYTGGTTVNNGGTLVLTGANNAIGVIRGPLTINAGGTVNTTTANALGFGAGVHVDTLNIVGGLLNNTAAGDQGWAVAINLTEGTLQSNGGVSDAASAQLFALGGGSSVNSFASAASSVISGRVNLRETNPNDQLPFNVEDGAALIDLNVSAAITANAATRGIVKNGEGVLLLGGISSYTGTTTINAGTLALGPSASLASPLVTVALGATFDVSAISGFGITSGSTVNVATGGLLRGPVEVGAGAVLIAGSNPVFGPDVTGNVTNSGTIRIAGAGVAGTLTLSDNLTLNDGSTINFDLSNDTIVGGGVNDLLEVQGLLTLSGTSTIAINQLNGALASGSYTLFTYAGGLSGNASNLALSGVVTTGRRTYTFDTTTILGSILLTVAGEPADITWVGNGTVNPWDLMSPVWDNAGGSDKYYDQDNVTFSDSGSNSPNVTVNEVVQPGSVVVNNSIKDFTFTGSGSIAGTTGLTKNGIRKLTISTTNSFTGAVAINEGTVSVATVADGGANSPLGAGTAISLGDLATKGTLQYTGPTGSTNRLLTLNSGGGTIEVSTAGTTLTASGLITGDGVLTKTGNGTLVLNNAGSSFTGNIVVDGGTLTASVFSNGATGALGVDSLPGRLVIVNNGATLRYTVNNIFGNGVGNPDLPAIILNGSTLTATRYNVVGNLTLNGGTLTQASTETNANYEGWQFLGEVTVTGSAPSTISTTTGKADHLGANTTFDVADVTGSAATDLTISAPLRNQSGDFGLAPGALTKTGDGTLTITGAQSYSTLNQEAGTTNLMTSLPNATINGDGGTLVINADASNSIVNTNDGNSTYFTASQTLASLTISDGGVAVLANTPPAPFDESVAAFGDEAAVASGAAPVPEPSSFALLLLSAFVPFCGRRRRR